MSDKSDLYMERGVDTLLFIVMLPAIIPFYAVYGLIWLLGWASTRMCPPKDPS